jgi:predicted PurR-regulated permease PerM
MERLKRISPRALRTSVAIFAILAALVLFRDIAMTLVKLLAEAGAAAFVLEPVSRMYETKMNRSWASLLAVLTAFLVVALICLLLVPAIAGPLADLYASLPATLSYLKRLLDGAQSALDALGISLGSLSATVQARFEGFAMSLATSVAHVASTVARLVIVITISYFILRDRERLQLRLELLVPLKFRERVVRACSTAQRELHMYIKGQLMISLIVGVLTAVGLAAARVPAGVWLGLLTGLLDVIPYFGPVLACVPVTIASLTVDLPCAIVALAVLIAVQQVEGLVISPRVMSGVTGFSSAFVIVTLYAAGAYKGVLGMLLALPVLILIRTCIRVFVESGAGN